MPDQESGAVAQPSKDERSTQNKTCSEKKAYDLIVQDISNTHTHCIHKKIHDDVTPTLSQSDCGVAVGSFSFCGVVRLIPRISSASGVPAIGRSFRRDTPTGETFSRYAMAKTRSMSMAENVGLHHRDTGTESRM